MHTPRIGSRKPVSGSGTLTAAFRQPGVRVIAIATAGLVLAALPLAGQRVNSGPARDSRDLLLAALGVATIECLGTVGPTTFTTASGVLARTFRACRSGDPEALQRVDDLLGVQFSAEGRTDDLSGHFVATWNAFTESFPDSRVPTCPDWSLKNVIDAPTHESVARFMSHGWIGKENRRYEISSAECRTAQCAVTNAIACAGGFGPGFIVEGDSRRSLVEVDPAWWLTTYTPPTEKNPCNPFVTDGNCDPYRGNTWIHGYCDSIKSNPGSKYASLQRVGEPCCFWSEEAQKIYLDGKFVPIDCADGPEVWYCMAYCAFP